jgi:hypothetical protein
MVCFIHNGGGGIAIGTELAKVPVIGELIELGTATYFVEALDGEARLLHQGGTVTAKRVRVRPYNAIEAIAEAL